MASDSSLTSINDIFGFELLYKSIENQLSKKEDVLVLFVHWYLIKSGFKCLGQGDSKTIAPNEIGSELLPDGWNQAPTYSLRYVREGKLYILVGIKSEADLLINFLKIEDQSVTNVQFSIETVQDIKGTLDTMLPNFASVLKDLKDNLVSPMYLNTGVDASTQATSSREISVDPLRVEPHQRHSHHHPLCQPNLVNPMGGLGADDLNPLGRIGISRPGGGGGMLFDPFSENRRRVPPPGVGIPGRLPPGAIPPGARFDPFGPPHPDPPRSFSRNPDNDDLPPPGYGDMFM